MLFVLPPRSRLSLLSLLSTLPILPNFIAKEVAYHFLDFSLVEIFAVTVFVADLSMYLSVHAIFFAR